MLTSRAYFCSARAWLTLAWLTPLNLSFVPPRKARIFAFSPIKTPFEKSVKYIIRPKLTMPGALLRLRAASWNYVLAC